MALNDVEHSYCHHWSEHFLTNTSRVLPRKEYFVLDEIQGSYYNPSSMIKLVFTTEIKFEAPVRKKHRVNVVENILLNVETYRFVYSNYYQSENHKKKY